MIRFIPFASYQSPDSSRSLVHIGAWVDGCREFFNLNLKSLLCLVQHLLILFGADEGDGKTFGAKSSRASDSMQVGVRVVRHIIVEYDVDLLNVDTSAEDLGGDQDTVLEGLESLVDFDSVVVVRCWYCLLTFLPEECRGGWPCLGWSSWRVLLWAWWRTWRISQIWWLG